MYVCMYIQMILKIRIKQPPSSVIAVPVVVLLLVK